MQNMGGRMLDAWRNNQLKLFHNYSGILISLYDQSFWGTARRISYTGVSVLGFKLLLSKLRWIDLHASLTSERAKEKARKEWNLFDSRHVTKTWMTNPIKVNLHHSGKWAAVERATISMTNSLFKIHVYAWHTAHGNIHIKLPAHSDRPSKIYFCKDTLIAVKYFPLSQLSQSSIWESGRGRWLHLQ